VLRCIGHSFSGVNTAPACPFFSLPPTGKLISWRVCIRLVATVIYFLRRLRAYNDWTFVSIGKISQRLEWRDQSEVGHIRIFADSLEGNEFQVVEVDDPRLETILVV
jgi:hypothetical protein